MDCFLRFDLTIHHDFRLLLYLANNIEDKYIKSLSISKLEINIRNDEIPSKR